MLTGKLGTLPFLSFPVLRSILGAATGAGVSILVFGFIFPHVIIFLILATFISLIGPSNILTFSAYSQRSNSGASDWSDGRSSFSGGGASGDF